MKLIIIAFTFVLLMLPALEAGLTKTVWTLKDLLGNTVN
jgi:hypothetical protein